jgi:hypothetical protein
MQSLLTSREIEPAIFRIVSWNNRTFEDTSSKFTARWRILAPLLPWIGLSLFQPLIPIRPLLGSVPLGWHVARFQLPQNSELNGHCSVPVTLAKDRERERPQ